MQFEINSWESHSCFLGISPLVLTQQGVTHTLTGLRDLCCPPWVSSRTWSSQQRWHRKLGHKGKEPTTTSHTRGLLLLLDAGGRGVASVSWLLCWGQQLFLTPFNWPVSAPPKNHSVNHSCPCVPHANRNGSLPLPSQGWDEFSSQPYKYKQYNAYDLGGIHTVSALIRSWNHWSHQRLSLDPKCYCHNNAPPAVSNLGPTSSA